jgi:lipoprotein-anchoring transpeptidase ErfK/SrfK
VAALLALTGCDALTRAHGSDAASAAGELLAPAATPHPAPSPAPPLEPVPGLDLGLIRTAVVLDRLGFSPGVIDGKAGTSFANAVRAFQQAQNLPRTGRIDARTAPFLARWPDLAATRLVTIPAAFAAGPFSPIPAGPAAQAKLTALGYETLAEALAERFHTTTAVLAQLNPAGGLRAGLTVRVPNIGDPPLPVPALADKGWAQTLAALGVATDQPQAAAIEVSKRTGSLAAFDKAGKLIAAFPATMGSRYDPLPLGRWKIVGVVRDPVFQYNPRLFWDARPGAKKAMLPPGPNGPVGVVWINLSKPHYGIHGTPHPDLIGRSESHGCIRLTNWDAARLAQMVSQQTTVLFRR